MGEASKTSIGIEGFSLLQCYMSLRKVLKINQNTPFFKEKEFNFPLSRTHWFRGFLMQAHKTKKVVLQTRMYQKMPFSDRNVKNFGRQSQPFPQHHSPAESGTPSSIQHSAYALRLWSV